MARILVIDDQPLIRKLLHIDLSLAGHAVTESPDGPSGIAEALENPPDVVVLDFKLPGMDGAEVLRALKARQPRLPVFFFTVYGDFGNKQALAEADGCFVKSGDLTPLREAIARAVCRKPGAGRREGEHERAAPPGVFDIARGPENEETTP